MSSSASSVALVAVLRWYGERMLLWQGVGVRVLSALGATVALHKLGKSGALLSTGVKVLLYAIFALEIVANTTEGAQLVANDVQPSDFALFKHRTTEHRVHSALGSTLAFVGIAFNLRLTTQRPLLAGRTSAAFSAVFSVASFLLYGSFLVIDSLAGRIPFVFDLLQLLILLGALIDAFVIQRAIKRLFDSSNGQRFILKGAFQFRRNRQIIDLLKPLLWIACSKATVSTVADYGIANAAGIGYVYAFSMDHSLFSILSVFFLVRFLRQLLQSRSKAFESLQQRDFEARLTYDTNLPAWNADQLPPRPILRF